MRWIVRLVSGLVMLALVAVGLMLLIPTEEIARRAAAQVEAITGRSLTIAGPVKASLWPGIAVSTGTVRLSNAEWAGTDPMVEAAGLRIGLDTAALIGGTIRITGLELDSPVIRLQRHRDGRANWDLTRADAGAPAAGGTGGGLPEGFSLAEAKLRNGSIRLEDAARGISHALTGIEATLRLPDLAQAADLVLRADLNGQPITLDLSATPARALLAGNALRGRLALVAGGARMDFDGDFSAQPLRAEGALHVNGSDRVALGRLLGQAMPDLPAGFGATSLKLDGRARLLGQGDDLRLVLRDSLLVLDGTRLRLTADLNTGGARPQLDASITAESRLTLPAGKGGPSGPAAAGWSTERIDLSGLNALNADVSFAAPGLTASAVRMDALRGRVVINDGRAVVTLDELSAYEGRITGTVVANARGRGSMRADLVLDNLALQPLLRDAAGYERLIATANGRVSLLSSAASVSEMMQQLQGDGQLSLGRGELRGLDLLGMLRRLDTGYVGEGQSTIFDGISSGFSIAQGVLRADDLKLAAPYLRAEGKGVIGIGTRTLDYRIVPVALQKEDGSGGVSVPLKITGPWATPRFQLDLEALARPKIEAEKARAEERIRAEIARKAEQELGIKAQEGERLEDAAKRKLEDELRRGLGRLLGGN